MYIQKLQEELIEKILLIPTEDNRSSLERTLEIINELERDHINDIITTNYGEFTALDYVIIADSQGNNPILSARPRINNMMLVELENAIRNVGGKTSEELGPVQNEATLSRHSVENSHFDIVRFLRERGADINVANNHGATLLRHAVENGDLDTVRLLIERGANINVGNSNINVTAPLDSIISRSDNQETRSSALENVTVQSNMEGRENSL